ncbi:MAG: hypothetical protein AABY42_04375 [Nitrospirota bacterium]
MAGSDNQNEIQALRAEIKRLRKTLSELTPPLSALLSRRGFRIYKKEPPDDLLLPDEGFIDEYYKLLHRYSFRLFIRDVIKHQSQFSLRDVMRYATREVTADYIGYLTGTGLLKEKDGLYSLLKPVRSFGPTLEWFVSEIFRKEFSVEAIWGIKFKRPVVGGDYDLIAKMDGSMLYMEIKSSPPKQIYSNEVAAFLDRVFDLCPDISVFFMDTELRMKDKIVPMFEEELGRRDQDKSLSPSHLITDTGDAAPVIRIEKELFHIQNKIFIINARESIVSNIEKVLNCFFRRFL